MHEYCIGSGVLSYIICILSMFYLVVVVGSLYMMAAKIKNFFAIYSLPQNCLPVENRHVPTAKEIPR
jgi:hypothetical protein